MSLNGLDVSAVVEAHQVVLADPGGWFLLKYVTRDTVELLSRGTGGLTEIKSEVQQYEEKSPLYGLLQYRRKKVVLKYVPEGTSRLLQVRLTVQFQSILDAFPHDTVFSFTTPSEVVDSALGLSTMLQPMAHPSLAPSTSSGRHHRLNGISEDGEEPGLVLREDAITIPPPSPRGQKTSQRSYKNDLETLPASAIKAKALLAKRKEAEAESAAAIAALSSPVQSTPIPSPPPPPPQEDTTSLRPRTAPNADIVARSFEKAPSTTSVSSRPRTARTAPRSLKEARVPLPPPPTTLDLRSLSEIHTTRDNLTPHLSSNGNDSISQWNEQVAAYTAPVPKPKKKLGPRPHIDTAARPKTPSGVAILPQSIRTSSRANVHQPARPDSRQSSRSVPSRLVPTQTQAPPLPAASHLAALYRSPESRNAPSVASSAVTDVSSSVAPEKLRLMKALQMRKRNGLLAQRTASAQSNRTQAGYRDDFYMRYVPEAPEQHPIVSATPLTATDQPVRVLIEHKGAINSSTTSPTSATTTSVDHSTKPSSLSGTIDEKRSQESFSIDTDSSITPKQTAGQNQLVEARSSVDDRNDLDSEDGPKIHVPTPPMSSVDQAYKRLTGSWTPPQPETIVNQSTPTRKILPVETESKSLVLATSLLSIKNVPSQQSLRSKASSGGRSRRRPRLDGTQTPTSAEISDGSDDESFIEELRNATVHEAKPMSVSRNPTIPTMRKLSVDKTRDITSAMPTLIQGNTTETQRSMNTTSSEQDGSRSASTHSMSTALPYWPALNEDGSPSIPLSTKPTLGSGISKRIKALETITNRDSIHSSSPPLREAASRRSAFTNLMNRASFVAQAQVPNASTDRSPPKWEPEFKKTAAATDFGDTEAGSLLERRRENAEIFTPQIKGETVSITARIVRDRPATSSSKIHGDTSASLHRSPLIVERERPGMSLFPSRTTRDSSSILLEPPPLSPTSDRHRFSFSSHKSGSTARQSNSDGRTSRLSIIGRRDKNSRANSETSSVDEQKQSRGSRLMKRMSNLGSRFGHNSNVRSPARDRNPPDTIMEQSEPFQRPESTFTADSALQVVDIGDVNVQFPETLLWKRKFMRIDDQGFLIFSPPSDNSHVRTANRKYHLSDIKVPTLPDREREEMAWSICLDLRDGGCIQCACESMQSQRQILKMLLDAHDAYNSLYNN